MLLQHIKIKIAFVVLMIFILKIDANPELDRVVSGQIELQKKNNDLIIYQTSKKAIIDWKDFSIDEKEKTHIQAIKDNSALLNRVVSSNTSEIMGMLTSNANVYLLNQNGILIGKKAIIDTKKLTLSTLDISNDEFLNANDLHFQTNLNEKIINKGILKAHDDIFIIAPKVKNKNEIVSKKGKVNLLGTMDLILADRKRPNIQVGLKNKGSISNKGFIKGAVVKLKSAGNNIFSLALNDQGIIQATGATNKKGRVILTADKGIVLVDSKIKANDIQIMGEEIYVEDRAFLDVSSDSIKGQILIGGDEKGKNLKIKNAQKTKIHSKAKIIADGLKDNVGGKIVIFSENQTICEGYLSAKGQNSDAGFIEISSDHDLKNNSVVDLSSLNGNKGILSLDPGSVLIKKGSNDDLQANVFSDSYINEQLKKANVEISTQNSTNDEAQSITIDKDVNILWDQDTTFSLIADKNIVMKPNSKIENTSSNDFLALHFKTIGENGNYTGILIDEKATIKTNKGNIKLEGISGNIGDANYAIVHRGLIQTKGKLDLIGKAQRGDNNNVGIYFDGGEIFSKDALINIEGSSLGTKQANNGINIANLSKFLFENSKIYISGIASGTNSSGVNFGKCKIETTGIGLLDIFGKEAGKLGINISEDAQIFSEVPIVFTATNSMHSYGHIVSRDNLKIDIGKENSGMFVLKRKIIAKELTLLGNNFNDTFYFDCAQICKVFGSKGQNTLIAADLANKFEITGINKGILNNEIYFSQIQNLKGSNYNDDLFVFLKDAKFDGKIDGNGGKNTLKAFDRDNLWVITSEDAGYIKGVVTFRNIQNLSGGNKNDTFKFLQDGKVNGILKGCGGYNILDYSSYNENLTLDLHKAENINEVIGSLNNQNTLIGPQDVNIWKITDKNFGTIGNIKFSYFQNLIGSGINDIFYIEGNGKLDGQINGSGGDNTLYASNRNNIWHITGPNRGYIENVLAFVNIQNLYGNEKADIFNFLQYAYISGKIDGKSSANNVLDFSEHVSNVSLDLNNIDNIQKIIGNGKITLIGKNIDNLWDITDENAGLLNKKLAFINIANIIGGLKKDIFKIEKQGSLAGYIDGRQGENTLLSSEMDNTWNIYGLNEGFLNNLNFKNVSNLIGSTNKDSFIFQDKALISGNIDGGLGTDNILDYSKKVSPVTVDLNKIQHVSKIIGGKRADTLIGRNQNNIWLFSSYNEGHVQDVDFIGFENIKGGSQSDVFVFRDNTGVSGVIDGGSDNIALNILDYSLCTKPISADIYSGEATNALKITNIQATVLPNFKYLNNNEVAKGIEIPLKQTEFDFDYYEDNFVKFFDSSSRLNADFGFHKFQFPIYVTKTKQGYVYVYRANSPFVITKRTMQAIYINATLGPYLADNRVADGCIRMKNNLLTTTNNQRLAIRGTLDQVNTVYEQDETGFDKPEFRVESLAIKERSIRQRPRPLHYYLKTSKL